MKVKVIKRRKAVELYLEGSRRFLLVSYGQLVGIIQDIPYRQPVITAQIPSPTTRQHLEDWFMSHHRDITMAIEWEQDILDNILESIDYQAGG